MLVALTTGVHFRAETMLSANASILAASSGRHKMANAEELIRSFLAAGVFLRSSEMVMISRSERVRSMSKI